LLRKCLRDTEADAAGGPRGKRGFAFERDDRSPDELGCSETIVSIATLSVFMTDPALHHVACEGSTE
jgi:hypothetical protein